MNNLTATAVLSISLSAIVYLQQSVAPMADGAGEEAAMTDGAAMEMENGALVAANDKVCVRNASNHNHFFAAEGKGTERLTAMLSPGEQLCATARGDGWAGVVSVYESEAVIEGCSRLVKAGTVEQLFKYVDFDRCSWSSNSPA